VAYTTVQELAEFVRQPTWATTRTADLQACLDAATIEVDHAIDRPAEAPLPITDPLAGRVCLVRAAEWLKQNDVMFGVVGFAETGALQAPRDSFARHARELVPLKLRWGLA
jgi:hypothetical protein